MRREGGKKEGREKVGGEEERGKVSSASLFHPFSMTNLAMCFCSIEGRRKKGVSREKKGRKGGKASIVIGQLSHCFATVSD